MSALATTAATICIEIFLCLAIFNPRRACAARVTVVGSVCVSVSVCLSVKSHLTYRVSVRPENAVTYSAGNEGQKICENLPETTAFKSNGIFAHPKVHHNHCQVGLWILKS